MKKIFQGALTALVTPFKDGAFDEEAYRSFIAWQIAQGIHGVVPCGTTGESATLTQKEYETVLNVCIEQVNGHVPILAGAGANDTAKAIYNTKIAQKIGVDGVLHVTPYYNKPSQEGLYRHFKAIAEEVDIPIVLYNVPGRTGCNLLPETVARIAHDFSNVIGIKEATGDLKQLSEVVEFCPRSFQVLTGDDFTVLPTLAVGGCGVVSVVSNIMPSVMVNLCNTAIKGDIQEARRLHYVLAPLSRFMFVESNPVPVKTALALMGKINLELRLPLTELSRKNRDNLEQALKTAGII